MGSLDTKKIWKKLSADPEFKKGTPEGAHEAYRELIEALPKVLGDRLKDKVSLSTLMQAKLDIVEYMLESGFVTKLVTAAMEAMPEELRPDPEELVAGLKDAMATSRMPLMEMIHNTAAFLAENGVTEEQVLSTPCGLNRVSLKGVKRGTLTIAELLESQPGVFLTATATAS